MGFFDNLGDKLQAGGSKVVEKTKEAAEIAKLTATVEKEKLAMDKVYTDIAKKFYEQFRDELAAKFPEETAKLDESAKKIAEAKAALKEVKGVQACPACGKDVDKDVKFCPACGAAMPSVAEEAPAEETNE